MSLRTRAQAEQGPAELVRLRMRMARPVGEIVTLVSTDTMRLQNLFPYLHAGWSSILQASLAIYFLAGQLGGATLTAVLMILIAIVANWEIQRRIKVSIQ